MQTLHTLSRATDKIKYIVKSNEFHKLCCYIPPPFTVPAVRLQTSKRFTYSELSDGCLWDLFCPGLFLILALFCCSQMLDEIYCFKLSLLVTTSWNFGIACIANSKFYLFFGNCEKIPDWRTHAASASLIHVGGKTVTGNLSHMQKNSLG